MNDTEALIRKLSGETTLVRRLPPPLNLTVGLLFACLVCGVLGQLCLGVRFDFAARLTDAYFWTELACLLLLLASSLLACVLAMYPDAYQRPALMRLPYVAFGLLMLQCALHVDAQPHLQMQDATDAQGLICTLLIAAVAFVPSMLLMALLMRGAVVHRRQAGALAFLAGMALGALVVRLHEADDSMVHILTWHYLPCVLFAVLGVYVGQRLLKW